MLRTLKRKAVALLNRTRLRVPKLSWSMLVSLYRYAQLVEVVRVLRSRHGCPWDQKQTLQDMLPYLKEEAAEIYDAARYIQEGDHEPFAREIGDLLFVLTFLIEICHEVGAFVRSLPAQSLVEKLVRRHPHVFSDAPNDQQSIRETWQQIKQQERSESFRPRSILERAKPSLSALREAQNVGKAVASVGFDWPTLEQVWSKVCEEVEELRDEFFSEEKGQKERQSQELGDLLFALTNLARHLQLDSETSLREATEKFRRRFSFVETTIHQQNRALEQTSLQEMEELWQEAKKQPSLPPTPPRQI